MLAAHRNFDTLMAEDVKFRAKLLEIFGQNVANFAEENDGLRSKFRHMLVPAYPTVWRLHWGCAQWFLFDDLHRELEKHIFESFRSAGKSCEKLISIHFRGGDTSFSEQLSKRTSRHNDETEAMIGRWARRVRTPIAAAELYFFYAKQLRKAWNASDVCYFLATDNMSIFPIAESMLGNDVYKTPGFPLHSSLLKSKETTIKALADYVLLGMADGLVHGMSTLSESAVERNFGQNHEIKCRSPHKKLWTKTLSWYCIQKGEHLDLRARKAIEYIKKTKATRKFWVK